MTRSQSASVILNSRLSRVTPALLTSTTGGPSSAAIRSTAACTCSASPTSAPTASARPPAASIACDGVVGVVLLQVEHGDGEPVGGQPLRGGGADAPGRPGDDRDPVVTSHPLEQRGQPLAAADAHRLQAVAGVAAVHLAQQGRQDAPAGRAHRVAEGDARAVDVGPLEVAVGEAPLAGHRQHLAGERLVELDQVDVGELDVGLRQRLRRRRHRADAHGLRRHAGRRPRRRAGPAAAGPARRPSPGR